MMVALALASLVNSSLSAGLILSHSFEFSCEDIKLLSFVME